MTGEVSSEDRALVLFTLLSAGFTAVSVKREVRGNDQLPHLHVHADTTSLKSLIPLNSCY